jgi:outer membrane protein OmpA-like peptidoglycan-associated protein
MKRLENFGVIPENQLAPPLFQVRQAQIDPKLLDQPEEIRVSISDKPRARVDVPIEKPEPQVITIAPQTNEIASPLLLDKPKVGQVSNDMLAKLEADSAGRDDKALGSLASQLLKETAPSKNQRIIKVPTRGKEGDGFGGSEGLPGRQSVEEALSKAGEPGATDKPVAMPGGALFPHDNADLIAESIDNLRKLAELISKYPNATFVISGHTDTTGTPEYNRKLSERRADAVKAWLVGNIGIAAERIQTVGKGSSEPIAAPEGSIEEQAPNRRVEILIKTRRK